MDVSFTLWSLVVIIMKRQYETHFRAWLGGKNQILKECCFRRELYCHEICHLVAIIRAFPSDRSSRAREDFISKIKEKFLKSVKTAEEIMAVPLVSVENQGISPSVFDKDHFRYGNDSVNYFKLYQELMLPYDRMIDSAKHFCAWLFFGKKGQIPLFFLTIWGCCGIS